MSELTLSYSLADQDFGRTKSLGILNLSVQLGATLGHSGQFARFTVFSNPQLAKDPLLSHFETQLFDSAADGGLGRVRWDQWQCYSAARKSGNRWLFLPKGFASFVRPPPVKLAVYVHDVMHDFYLRRFPQATSARERYYFQRAFIATLRHADIIFTNTEFTRSEVMRVADETNLAPPRIEVAGIGFVSGPPPLANAKSNRILLLAGRAPHKKTELAVSWLKRWVEVSRFDGEVHLVGSHPEGLQVPAEGRWHHHVRPDDSQYKALLNSVRVLVYISEYEGFGMPPVEAAIAGACPVYSDLPPTREVMREAGLRFSNGSFESFREALDRGLNVSPGTVATWRDELLARHSWRLVGERVIGGLHQLESGSRPAPGRGHPVTTVSRHQVIHIGGAKRALASLLGWAATGIRAWRKSDLETPGRSVLIVEPFGLGDVIMHEPMIRALREGGFDVTFCGRAEWRALFPPLPWIDSKIAWGQHQESRKYVFGSYVNPAFRRFFRELRLAGQKSKIGIDTRGDIRSVLLLYAAGCRKVITLSSYLGSDLAMAPGAAEIVEFSPDLHRWQSNLLCVRPLGLTGHVSRPAFPHLLKPLGQSRKCVGFIPVAPWRGKWWERRKWQALAAWLQSQGWEVRALCGPRQMEIAQAQVGTAVRVTEITSVLEWADQLQEFAALVTLDTGPMHLADVLGIPVVALFGQGLLPLWAPGGNESRVISHQADPGFRPCPPTEKNANDARRWMARIEVDEVVAVLEPILEKRRQMLNPLIPDP